MCLFFKNSELEIIRILPSLRALSYMCFGSTLVMVISISCPYSSCFVPVANYIYLTPHTYCKVAALLSFFPFYYHS